MGTNFYLYVPGGLVGAGDHERGPFLDDGNDGAGVPAFYEMHIGKSSAGWKFALRLYDGLEEDSRGVEPPKELRRDPPKRLRRWLELFSIDRAVIVDEYGDRWSVDRLVKNITQRSHPCGLWSHDDAIEVDGATYDLVRRDFS